jgi:hypothetical protein
MVQLFVAVTDQSWFDRLSASSPHDEVNFWAPSGRNEFRALQPGELFLSSCTLPTTSSLEGAYSVTRRTYRSPLHGKHSAPRTVWRTWSRCGHALRSIGAIRRFWISD